MITDLVIFSQDIYCGGYSGEDPPLPIPNREVKLTIADGTAPPGGRVGSCHFLLKALRLCLGAFLFICIVAANVLTLSHLLIPPAAKGEQEVLGNRLIISEIAATVLLEWFLVMH